MLSIGSQPSVSLVGNGWRSWLCREFHAPFFLITSGSLNYFLTRIIDSEYDFDFTRPFA